MAHIHTRPGQHDHTVSIYIIRTDFNEPKVLLHLHRKVQLYAQFGGHIELDETPWHTTIHEIREEAGYDISQLSLLQPVQRLDHVGQAIVHPQPIVHATMGYPTDEHHYHTDSAYAFVAKNAPAYAPDEGESTDIRLFTRGEILHHTNIDDITRDTALYTLDTILPTWVSVSPHMFK
jgi:8-oxo-dGTP pyrophosphatase MutT (NUDIX family)